MNSVACAREYGLHVTFKLLIIHGFKIADLCEQKLHIATAFMLD